MTWTLLKANLCTFVKIGLRRPKNHHGTVISLGSRAAKKGRKVNCTGKIFILLRTSVTGDYRRTLRSQTCSPGRIPCRDKSDSWLQRAQSVITCDSRTEQTLRDNRQVTWPQGTRPAWGLPFDPWICWLSLCDSWVSTNGQIWPLFECVCVCVPCLLRWFKCLFFPCFLPTVVWTGTNSRSSQSFSSSPTPNWDDCEYTFLIFPSFHPELSPSLPLSISSDVLRDPSECTATVLCQNFYRGWGFKSLAVVTQCCSMLLRGGEKECVSASVRPVFKRWKGAWSECFAWTREEFLFRNTSFP